jgi:hypothetical protein
MVKMEKKKKGAVHVEVIISFAIFISFLVFAFVMIKPWNILSRSTSNLDITKTGVMDYVLTNLTVFSLKINSTVYSGSSGSCFNANFDTSLLGGEVIMKNSAGEIIDSTVQTNLYFENSGSFYKIYSSDELKEQPASTVGCYSLNTNSYTLGAKRVHKKVSYSKLTNLFQEYESDYEQLKNNLGLNNNFNIAVLNSSRGVIGNFKAEEYKPEAIEITARDVPIEILDENATLSIAIMNIQVW